MNEYKNSVSPDGNVIFTYAPNLPAFDARKEKNIIVHWIQRFFSSTNASVAVVGISGGKDSSVVASLCVEALGADNVIGVKMPNGTQPDIDAANQLIDHLGIRSLEYDISPIVQSFTQQAADICIATPGWTLPSDNDIPESMWDVPETNRELCAQAADADDIGIYEMGYVLPERTSMNLTARVRLCVLYMIAQSLRSSARVVGTANLSEGFIGWDTRFGGSGASGCDLSPIANYTASEVQALGYVLGLPASLIDKPPADGLCGRSDEENFGFSYSELDSYIRLGDDAKIPEDVRWKIDEMHVRNEFKLRMPPSCFTDVQVIAR